MASVLDLVKHYQHAIEKNVHDEQKILKCIDKLFNLQVTVQHLQETGVGRTVNALRKEPGEVGQAARALVSKWKLMVAAEESDQETDHNDTANHNGYGNNKDSDENSRQTYHNKEEKHERRSTSSKREESRSHGEMNGNSSGSKRKYHSSEEEEPHNKKTKSSDGINRDSYKKSIVKSEPKTETESEDGESDHTDESESEISDSTVEETKVKTEVKVKKEPTEHHKSSKHSSSKHEDHKKEKHNHDSKSSKHSSTGSKDRHSSEKSHSSHKSTKEKENSSGKKHKLDHKEKERDKDKEKDKKHKEEPKTSKHYCSDKHKSSSQSDSGTDKHKNEKHSSKSEKHKSSSHSHKSDKDKHKSSSEKEISNDKYKSKDCSSSQDKNSSSSKEKLKEKSSSSSNRDKSDKSEKKHSTSSEKSKSHDKSKDKVDDKSSDRLKHKSSSSSHKSSKSSSSKSSEEIPKKKNHVTPNGDSDDGIGCESGASFAEALGMISPAKPKKKSLKDSISPGNPDLSPAALLAPTAKLAPLPALEISALPEISPNYKPRPPPKLIPHFTDEEAMSAVISSKNQRTKVYSGNKVIGKIPTLYEMCVHILQEHIDALEYTGGVPYEILKPVIDRATPDQLFLLEHYNPYLMEDTDHLWQKFCEKNFRRQQRQEMETWREMYIRCQEEQEVKLRSLTENIKIAQEAKKAPIKQTKMAYVDSVVKPPRNIARKQALHGTAHAAAASPAARVASLAAAPNILRGGTRPVLPPAAGSSFKPKKAPLMAKALQFMRGRKR